MNVLVDTSVWIDYFRSGDHSSALDMLIENNLVATNELILTELIPALTVRKQTKLIALLRLLPVQPLKIDFDAIITLQTNCLKKGLNGIGIPDLIVAQNAFQNKSPLYTLDKHFHWLQPIFPLHLFTP